MCDCVCTKPGEYRVLSNGIDCYQNILQILKNDYPIVAKKLEHELLKERTSLSKDINDSLIEIINKQLLPIVHGTGTGRVKSGIFSFWGVA
jgi:hypothetical protein